MTQYYHGHYHALRNGLSLNTQVVAANARGEDRTLMPFIRQGILSPALPPNRQRQRGYGKVSTCIGAHGHPKSCYHERYHAPSPVRSFRVPPEIR